MTLRYVLLQFVCYLLVFTMAVTLGGCRKTLTGESLREAAYAGNITEVNWILAQNAGAINDPDPLTGMTAIEYAIIGQHSAVVKTLLQHGADANVYDKLGMNPVAHAIRKNNWTIVQLLLDHGAHIKDVRFLKEKVTPLMIAAIEGNISMVDPLLKLGLDRNARDSDGMTAADYARINGHEDMANLLERTVTTVPATQPVDGTSGTQEAKRRTENN